MDTRSESRWQTTSFGSRWRLGALESPQLGGHLVTGRKGYTHHGIYIGDGRVVHYAGLSRVWLARPVAEVSLAEFAQGRTIWVEPHLNPRFAPEDIVARAKSRLGEDEYRIASNNCEHFCEWCVQGESRSRQIEAWLRKPQHLRRRCTQLAARWVQRLLIVDSWNNWWAI